MSKERLSNFANKYIQWDIIIKEIVDIAREKTKTEWGKGDQK